jgi:hypothetical protein
VVGVWWEVEVGWSVDWGVWTEGMGFGDRGVV